MRIKRQKVQNRMKNKTVKTEDRERNTELERYSDNLPQHNS